MGIVILMTMIVAVVAVVVVFFPPVPPKTAKISTPNAISPNQFQIANTLWIPCPFQVFKLVEIFHLDSLVYWERMD